MSALFPADPEGGKNNAAAGGDSMGFMSFPSQSAGGMGVHSSAGGPNLSHNAGPFGSGSFGQFPADSIGGHAAPDDDYSNEPPLLQGMPHSASTLRPTVAVAAHAHFPCPTRR